MMILSAPPRHRSLQNHAAAMSILSPEMEESWHVALLR